MYRTVWFPESSYAVDANLKGVDRQWIAQELFFYLVNILFKAVHFDNITSQNSIVSLPFATDLHNWTQISPYIRNYQHQNYQLPISSLVHTLSDNRVATNFCPTLVCRSSIHHHHHEQCSAQGQLLHKLRHHDCNSAQRQVFHCKLRNLSCSFY